jgi:hypothetical protein
MFIVSTRNLTARNLEAWTLPKTDASILQGQTLVTDLVTFMCRADAATQQPSRLNLPPPATASKSLAESTQHIALPWLMCCCRCHRPRRGHTKQLD